MCGILRALFRMVRGRNQADAQAARRPRHPLLFHAQRQLLAERGKQCGRPRQKPDPRLEVRGDGLLQTRARARRLESRRRRSEFRRRAIGEIRIARRIPQSRARVHSGGWRPSHRSHREKHETLYHAATRRGHMSQSWLRSRRVDSRESRPHSFAALQRLVSRPRQGLLSLFLRSTVFAVCAVFLVAAAHAQYRASIQGVVTDSQGAVVSGATITLQNEETGQTSKTTSDDGGVYNFNGLPPSKFTITAEKNGFKKKVIKGFGVIAEQANSVNIQLEVGQVAESITVSGDEVPLIDTETSNLQGTVKADEFQKLPSFGRDPFQLLQLAPGAFGDGARTNGPNGGNNLPSTTVGRTGGADGAFKSENGRQDTAGGARTGENNYTLDGVNTGSVTGGGTTS